MRMANPEELTSCILESKAKTHKAYTNTKALHPLKNGSSFEIMLLNPQQAPETSRRLR
jgi:hypothetical protein